jgi:hypothetical protein
MTRTERLKRYEKATQHVAKIDNTIVNHSKLKAAIDGLEECIIWSKFNKEPAGAVLVGEGGTGKTTVCSAILAMYPPSIVETKAVRIRVTSAFYASVPSPSSIKTLAAELLKNLGDPKPRSGTADTLTERLVKLLKISQTKIILLDEFQHLLADSKVGDSRANKICDWIKTLVNETGVTICLVGTPNCEALVNSDPQLGGRFARRFRLHPLALGTERSRGELESFLLAMGSKFVERLGFTSVPDFVDHTNAVRMWAATGGNLRSVMRLLKESGVIALSANRKDLVISDLAEAFDEGVTEFQAKCDLNPFSVSYESLLGALSAVKIRL